MNESAASIDLLLYLDRLWITSDQHFGHEAIARHTGRPFSAGDQDGEMARRWIETVPIDEPLLHLGDLVVNPTSDAIWGMVSTLTGTPKWLLPGNHDKSRRLAQAAEAGFTVIRPPTLLWRERLVHFTHEPIPGEELEAEDSFNVHGHTHNNPEFLPHPRRFNVCVEVTDYRPIRLATILETLVP